MLSSIWSISNSIGNKLSFLNCDLENKYEYWIEKSARIYRKSIWLLCKKHTDILVYGVTYSILIYLWVIEIYTRQEDAEGTYMYNWRILQLEMMA